MEAIQLLYDSGREKILTITGRKRHNFLNLFFSFKSNVDKWTEG